MNSETLSSRYSGGKRLLSVVLTSALMVTSFAGLGAVTSTTASAASNNYGLVSNIQDGTILHCFDWKYNDIKAELANIAKAGFSTVQTSAAQPQGGSGAWWWMYQPLGFYVGENALGNKNDLKSLCDEAEKYGIKVIVDVVANHLAGDHSRIQSDLKDSQYWHDDIGNADDGDRYRVTHGKIGMPDINSEHSYVQQVVNNYTLELKNLGVDGLRWDAAKHIGLPSEGCNFWPAVTSQGMFHYGEILNNPGISNDNPQATEIMKEYSQYMTITDSTYGMNVRDAFKNGSAPDAYGNYVAKGISDTKIIYWGESHDNWSNNSDWGYSWGHSQNVIDRAYATVASRNNITALYFSRPSTHVKDDIMSGVKGSTHFTSAEVAAVNHFHNAMVGKADYYTKSNNCAVITRKGGGAVIVKGSGSGDVSVTNGGGYAAPGTYKDEITGNTFTVTSSTISGKVGDSGIAVIYDQSQQSSQVSEISQQSSQQSSEVSTVNADAGTIIFDNSSTNWSNVNVYVYTEGSSVVNNAAWPGEAMSSAGGNKYTYKVPSKFSGTVKVIFNGSGGQIPGSMQPGYDMDTTKVGTYENGSWSLSEPQQSSVQSSTVQSSTQSSTQSSQQSSDVPGNDPMVQFSKGDKTTFTTETLDVTLTLRNASSGTYSVDGGPVKKFTGTTTATLGQGKVGDSTVTLAVTATNGSKTTKYNYTYTKDYVVKTTASSASLSSYYSTNKNGKGANKTITVDGDISDWDSSMLIAQGTANDDPRVYRPNSMYEVGLDLYALYGAYDDNNLYLMWEMTNVQDVVAPGDDYPLTQGTLYMNMNIPFFIALDTGKSDTIGQGGKTVAGGTIWDSGITFGQNSFNRLIAISTNGANGPYVYGGDSSGLNPSEIYGPRANPTTGSQATGIQFKYGKGILSKNVYGLDGAYGTTSSTNPRTVGDMCNENGMWVDFNTKGHNSATMDFHYEMAIPLSELGVTKADVESTGIGALLIITSGKSGMDCLPYDLSMNDNADLDDSAGSQENNSFEKSDEDDITTAFARIGAGSTPPSPPVGTPLQVNFGANLSAPQYAGTALTLSAVGYGGTAPYKYQFFVDGTSVKANNSTDTASWTPTAGSHTIKCVITDSEGKTATVSKTFTAEKGDNPPPVDELINNSKLSATSITLGSSVVATGSATGGKSPYQYAVYYKKTTSTSWATAQAYSSNAKVTIKPASTGTYNVCIKVKDSAGTEAKKYLSVTVKSGTTALANNSTISATSIQLGSTVTLKGAASGGKSPYQYAYFYKKSSSSSWTTIKAMSTTTSVSVKPQAATTYDLCVYAKDATGKNVKKYFTLKVTNSTTPLQINATSSASSVYVGSSVKFTAAGEGGTGSYTYAFYQKLSTQASYQTISNFSKTSSVYFAPNTAGTYSVCAKVKDSAGTVAKQYFTLKVSKATSTLTNNSTLSATTITKGSSITAKGAATGGTSPYQYAYFYKKTSESSWTQVKGYSTTTSVSITPKAATTYDVCVKVKDSKGTEAKKYFTVTVKAAATALEAKATVSAATINAGSSTKVTGSAVGGTAPYSYEISYMKIGSTAWTTAKSYSTTAYKTITFANAGVYSVRVNVKDAAGTVSSAYALVTVS